MSRPLSSRTHLQHYFVDSSSVRLKVQRLVVVVAQIHQLKYGVAYETEATCEGGTDESHLSRHLLTGAPLLHQVTGTEVVRVNRDGLLSDPELGAGLLTGDGIDLQLFS